MHYYKANIGDIATKVCGMSPAETGMYLRLLNETLRREAHPTKQDAYIWCRARSESEKADVDAVLSFCCEELDGVFVDSYARAAIAEYAASAEKYSAAAKARESKKKQNITKTEQDSAKSCHDFDGSCQDWTESCQDIGEIYQDSAKSCSNHKPLTINQEPETKNQEPVAATAVAAPARRRSATSSAKNHSATSATWAAYSSAFVNRYGTEPVRNAKVNGILANLVKRIGEDDAPHVAGFFVGHNDSFYVRRMHSVDMLLNSCEALHAQWKTGREMTNRKAQEVERMGFEFVSHHDGGEIF